MHGPDRASKGPATSASRVAEDVREAESKRFFDAFGFIVCRNLLHRNEVAAIRREAESIFDDDWGGIFDGGERQQIQGFVERSALLVDLIRDERILSRVEHLVGTDVIWVGSDGNRYVGSTGWHPDGSNFNVRRVKALFYLDQQNAHTGALRVFPGSHKSGLHDKLRVLLQRADETITPYGVLASRRSTTKASGLGIPADELPSYAVETKPGDVVFFDQNIWHSSFGGNPGRMMFTMNFASRPDDDAGWEFVMQMYHGQLNHVRNRQKGARDFLYGNIITTHPDPALSALITPMLDRGCR